MADLTACVRGCDDDPECLRGCIEKAIGEVHDAVHVYAVRCYNECVNAGGDRAACLAACAVHSAARYYIGEEDEDDWWEYGDDDWDEEW